MTRTCLLGGILALTGTLARGDDVVAPPIRLAQATSPARRPQAEPLPPLPATQPAPAANPAPAPNPAPAAPLRPRLIRGPDALAERSGLHAPGGQFAPAEPGEPVGRQHALTMIGDLGPFAAIRQASPGTVAAADPAALPAAHAAIRRRARGWRRRWRPRSAGSRSPRTSRRGRRTASISTSTSSRRSTRRSTSGSASPVDNLLAYRYMFGFEKTFLDRRASFGIRVPINTLTADSTITGNFARPGGTSTSMGDLSIFTKFVFCEDPRTGSLVSAGLQVTPPTGPGSFAGANYLQSIHTTTVQPYVGYIWARDRFYVHGFTSMQVPDEPGRRDDALQRLRRRLLPAPSRPEHRPRPPRPAGGADVRDPRQHADEPPQRLQPQRPGGDLELGGLHAMA